MISPAIVLPASRAGLVCLLLSTSATFGQFDRGEAVLPPQITWKTGTAAGKPVATARFEIREGFHTHSHKPSEPQFIATTLRLETTPAVKVESIEYPPGKSHKVEGIKKPLSVYEGAFELKIPLVLPSDIKRPLKIPATLSYQACQGPICFPPKKLKFDLVVPTAGP